MTSNIRNSTPEAQIGQAPNSSSIPIEVINGLTPIASLIVLGVVGTLFIDRLRLLVEAIRGK
jgi:hypothetical protein